MTTEVRRFEAPRWYWVSAVWCGVGLFDATQTVYVMRAEGMHHYWTRLYFTQLISWLPFMLATPCIWWLGSRFPVSRWRVASTWVAHLALCAAVNLSASAWITMFEEWLNPWAITPWPDPFLQLCLRKFSNGMLSTVILYGLVLLVGHILASQQRLAVQEAETARLSEQLTKAQLSALRRQIEPHFLFNTLNSIAGLVREQRNEAAVSMIARLSDFLRRVVNDSDRQQVPLSEEVEFTQKYLEIQKVRFGDRLAFTVDVPRELMSAQVPCLILQPMVENAVKHGIAKRVQGGAIRITAARSNDMLILSVENDGPSLPAEWEKTTSGIGVRNVRTRLESSYGDAFELNLRNQRGGVLSSLSLPYVEVQSNPAREVEPAAIVEHSTEVDYCERQA
ncbi:MAG TPA: sensor histidine kinase [Dongiaceae bacterium]|nr:sensor histidine kinase [Dongiaceae bacterium]